MWQHLGLHDAPVIPSLQWWIIHNPLPLKCFHHNGDHLFVTVATILKYFQNWISGFLQTKVVHIYSTTIVCQYIGSHDPMLMASKENGLNALWWETIVPSLQHCCTQPTDSRKLMTNQAKPYMHLFSTKFLCWNCTHTWLAFSNFAFLVACSTAVRSIVSGILTFDLMMAYILMSNQWLNPGYLKNLVLHQA